MEIHAVVYMVVRAARAKRATVSLVDVNLAHATAVNNVLVDQNVRAVFAVKKGNKQ